MVDRYRGLPVLHQGAMIKDGGIYALGVRIGELAKGGPKVISGGDVDVHGCVGSAGYVWCESRKKCIRLWEIDCPPAAIAPVVPPVPPIAPTPATPPVIPGTGMTIPTVGEGLAWAKTNWLSIVIVIGVLVAILGLMKGRR